MKLNQLIIAVLIVIILILVTILLGSSSPRNVNRPSENKIYYKVDEDGNVEELNESLIGAVSYLWKGDKQSSKFSPELDVEPKNMSVLVTGAAGFIGFHSSRALKRAGYKVVGIDNFNDYYDTQLKRDRASQLALDNIEVIEGDVCDSNKLEELLKRNNVNRVLHLAAQAGVRYSLKKPLAYVEANVRCFTVLLEAMRSYDASMPLVYASSSSVYGLNSKVPFSELDPVIQPASLYAATKRSDELIAHVYHNLYGIKTTGLRFFTVYGPYGRPDMAYFSFSNNIMQDKPIQIYNNGDVSRDFTYVDDIVDGIMKALRRAHLFKYEVFNLGNNHPHGVLELVDLLEQNLGKKAIKNFTAQAKGDVLTTFSDIAKAGSLLDYAPQTSLADGIKHFADWYKGYYSDKIKK